MTSRGVVGSPEPYYDEGGIQIFHGDCREMTAWDVAGAFMVTDPPYGIEFMSNMGGKFLGSQIANDNSLENRDAVLAAWSPRPALVFGSWKRRRPLETRHVIVWEKGDHVGMGDLSVPWRPNCEEIYVIGSGFQGHRGSSVLRFNAPSPNFTPEHLRLHPTEKPVDLMRALVDKCAPLAPIVDPFMGSGSTLRAAKDLGRSAIGVEIEERYCEIAAKRLAQEVLDFGGSA